MGIGTEVHGLDQLVKANDLLVKLQHNFLKMHHLTSNVTTKVTGLDKMKELFHFRHDLGHDVTSTVNVKTNAQSISELNHKIRSLQGWLNKSHDVKVDADTSAINQTKQKLGELKSQVGKLRNGFTGTGQGIQDVGHHVTGLGGRLHRTALQAHTLGGGLRRVGGEFKNAFTGGMVASGISSAFSGLKSVVKQGNALTLAGDKAKIAWKNIGLNGTQQNRMASQMEDIGQMTNMSDDDITRMQRSFYSLTDSAPKAQALTKEIVGFGKASGESNNEINRMGRTLPRVLASNKINASMFTRTFRQSPKLMDGIIKASGKSSASFKQMLGAGKLTSQQLQGYMAKAAKGSNQAWSEYTNTFGGRIAAMKKTWATAEKSFAKPFTNGLTKSMGELSGKNGSLTKVENSVKSISSSLGRKVGNYVGKAIAFLIKNQKPLMRIGSALFRIASIAGKTVFKTIAQTFGLMGGRSNSASHGVHGLANMLTNLSHHTKIVAAVTRTMMAAWAVVKFYKIVKVLRDMNRVLHLTFVRTKALKVISMVTLPIRRFVAAERDGIGVQKALNFAMKANPMGMIVTAIGLVAVGLVELYKHCATFRHAVQAVGRFGVKAFKAIWNGIKAVGKLAWALFKKSPMFHALKLLWRVGGKTFHFLGNAAHGMAHKAGHFIGGLTNKINHSGRSASRSTARSAAKSSKAVHGYLSKSGKYYKHYHKGLRKMSSASYKAQERMRSRAAKRSQAALKRYEAHYSKYQKKRSSLSRRYGKLRAMYSMKSLKTIEKRFNKLRKTIMKYAKNMFKGTRKWFRKIGSGGGKQFRAIYRAARRWLNRATRLQRKDYRTMNRNSRRLLDGSVKRYIAILRKRFKSQRYYDRMLIKQTKRTNTIMRKLPLGWVVKETKGLIANWKRQRHSYVVHNERMTKALVTHIHTMSHHFRNFKDSTENIFDELEDNVEKSFTKFFDKLHDIAGHGMNEVQAPLNTGAQHLNGFVSAFGETTPPLKAMPSVSYATGTGALSGVSGLRRPITQLTEAVLNDDKSSGQETVIHPDGNVEEPHGSHVHETLEPGAEVLNAKETSLMKSLASRPVHLATGTGLFSDLKKAMSGFSGGGNVTQATLLSHAHDKGKQRLLNEMENVIHSPAKVLTGMFGAKPNGERGIIGDIISGIYGTAGQQASDWWSTLIGQVNQELDEDGGGASSSKALNYAMNIAKGKGYKWGGNGPGGFDCSGLVRAMLDHFGIHQGGRVAGSEIDAFPHISRSEAKPGDLVGNHYHIGIVSDPGAHHYYSAFDYSQGIKNFPLDQTHWTSEDPHMTFSRVPELAKANQGDDKAAQKALQGVKSKGAIGGFVKHQMYPMEKWIEKNLEPLIDFGDISGTAGAWTKPGTQAHHIAEDVFRAAEHIGMDAKHAAAVVGNAWHESAGFEHGLKVNQFGGGGGKGLFQFTGQGSKFGWSPMGQVKSIMANALGSSASSWESSGGSPSSLAHSFETIFERGSIPAFAARDAAATRAYEMFGGGNHYAKGGHMKPGEIATVGEKGAELFQAGDTGGTVIPHEASKKIMNRTNNKPVNVKQDIHINVKDGSEQSRRSIVHTLDQYMSAWADKLNRGGALNV